MRPEIASQTRWRMGGLGIVIPITVKASDHPTLTPPEIEPAMLPLTSRIPALLILTRYDSTSTLSYSELALAVWARPRTGRLGLYCTHLWVDSEESIEAGRSLWQLSKQRARFDWQQERSARAVRVSVEDADLITVSFETPKAGFSFPISMRCFSLGEDARILGWTLRSRSALGRSRVSTTLPARSLLSTLVGHPRSGIALDPLDLTITIPRGMRG